MQLAVRRRLGAHGEVLGVDHRLALDGAVLADDGDVLAARRRELAREAAHRRRRHARRRREPCRLVVFRRRLHELRPQRHRDVGGEAVRQNRLGLIEADPHAGDELRREADEPRVVEAVGRAGLARGRQREAELPRARASARVDDVGHHARHQKRRRLADRARRRVR